MIIRVLKSSSADWNCGQNMALEAEKIFCGFVVILDCEAALLGQRKTGLLTELLGPGGECEGYKLRFVGHSLGGSIAALTALRVQKFFLNSRT